MTTVVWVGSQKKENFIVEVEEEFPNCKSSKIFEHVPNFRSLIMISDFIFIWGTQVKINPCVIIIYYKFGKKYSLFTNNSMY